MKGINRMYTYVIIADKLKQKNETMRLNEGRSIIQSTMNQQYRTNQPMHEQQNMF